MGVACLPGEAARMSVKTRVRALSGTTVYSGLGQKQAIFKIKVQSGLFDFRMAVTPDTGKRCGEQADEHDTHGQGDSSDRRRRNRS
jgi:hypothetical protein